MKTRILSIALVVFGCSACGQADTIVTYNAADDFSATTNGGSNVWSYGYCSALVGPSGFTAFTNARTWEAREVGAEDFTGLHAWDGISGYDPSVVYNAGSAVTAFGYTWAAGDLGLDSHGNGVDGPIVRWIAPEDGSVDISATFTNAGSASTLVYVFKNFAVVGSGNTSTGPVSSSGTLSVVKGDIIDFAASGSLGSVTILDATIAQTVVPEPGTLLLFGTGISGLLAYAWRRRR